jgi:hypothetical protein
VLKFSTVAILKWIRSFEAPVQDFRAKNPVKIVELEETYVHWFKKNIASIARASETIVKGKKTYAYQFNLMQSIHADIHQNFGIIFLRMMMR